MLNFNTKKKRKEMKNHNEGDNTQDKRNNKLFIIISKKENYKV